ncbi:glycerophosphoryl diester phosphodiesterase [Marinomonas primoryensis]|jgi:glycerophosphoryl diester phosphodiesterase|uniref:Glycerophosphoryl diester phosphodiesterase n=2 Tax=Marinomonas primoryensis TaxID=178399 RepID=A0A859D0Y6_9GAMM|nr:glycerophosphoryl diester phosphodiesterase [Marinomonas primoryensis]QKK82142.1 glycerophosphoryl diester phosphodiesterase [Marinomonas primoryensis]
MQNDKVLNDKVSNDHASKDRVLNTKVMGHRGAALLAPENTLASIRAAADAGATWVEIDVYLIAEGGLVIFHDDTLDRCTNGTGVTRDARPADVAELDAGSWFSADFAGEKVPTLLDALECIQSLNLGLNLEIKHDGADVENIVPTVLAMLRDHWEDNDNLMISSFNHAALQLCYDIDVDRHLAQLYEDIPEDWQAQLEGIKAYSLNCDYSRLTQSQAQAVKAAGYKLLCYTANDPRKVESHWAWGMDAVITDDPTKFAFLSA